MVMNAVGNEARKGPGPWGSAVTAVKAGGLEGLSEEAVATLGRVREIQVVSGTRSDLHLAVTRRCVSRRG